MKVTSSLFKNRYPGKKVLLSAVAAFLFSGMSLSQNFITFYYPGYQLSRFKATNVRMNYSGTEGDLKGSINHITAKGDGIANNLVFGADMTQLLTALIRGLTKNMGSVYGGIFEFRLGYAAQIGSSTKLGAGIDIGARGMNYVKDSIDLQGDYKFITTGITFVGLQSFDERIYVMPKLSLNPMFGKAVDKITDGMSVKFETSLGYRLGDKIGVSITPGIDRMKFLEKDVTPDYQTVVVERRINFTYLHFGISFMLD